jgi:hypothetical protein
MRRPDAKRNALSWRCHGEWPLPDARRAEYWATHTEGLERSRRANWKHGRRSAQAVARRKEAATIRREIRRLIALALSA